MTTHTSRTLTTTPTPDCCKKLPHQNNLEMVRYAKTYDRDTLDGAISLLVYCFGNNDMGVEWGFTLRGRDALNGIVALVLGLVGRTSIKPSQGISNYKLVFEPRQYIASTLTLYVPADELDFYNSFRNEIGRLASELENQYAIVLQIRPFVVPQEYIRISRRGTYFRVAVMRQGFEYTPTYLPLPTEENSYAYAKRLQSLHGENLLIIWE